MQPQGTQLHSEKLLTGALLNIRAGFRAQVPLLQFPIFDLSYIMQMTFLADSRQRHRLTKLEQRHPTAVFALMPD